MACRVLGLAALSRRPEVAEQIAKWTSSSEDELSLQGGKRSFWKRVEEGG